MKNKERTKKVRDFNMRGKGRVFLTIKIRDVHGSPTNRKKKSLQRKGSLIRKFILNSFSFLGIIFYALCRASLSQYA